MKYFILLLIPLAAIVLAGDAAAGIHKETVEYSHGETVLRGYICYDDAFEGKRPGVMVVHEWWGLNDYAKRRAEQLAGLGYIAFAADMYGNGKTAATSEEAGKLVTPFRKDRKLMRDRAMAGLEVLRKHELTDKKRLAAIGYCFGGGTVLELARSGADISGVVSFHGSLDNPNPEDAKNIKAKVLVLHGAEDRSVKIEDVVSFWKEMNKTDADWQLNIYSGSAHGFTNPAAGSDPSKGVAYNEKADLRSWEAMKMFLSEIFK
jgi:dienelactone hydrolase